MDSAKIAYFSMEIGFDFSIPTYSGGLGVLAGDTVKAAADIGLPMVAVSLVHRQGYFHQKLDRDGAQQETPDPWQPEKRLEAIPTRVQVEIEGKSVTVQAWRYVIEGVQGKTVPVYLLDTDLEENAPEHRELTHRLYGGDERYRLSQEVVLGMGGVALLNALGLEDLRVYHMNEGHSALLALALLEASGDNNSAEVLASVRERCVFTTHTPVPAGHDKFPVALARETLGEAKTDRLLSTGCCPDNNLNLTHVALFFSRYINGVAMRHGQVSREMFPDYEITSITNGVHAGTWTTPSFRDLYDRCIPDWRAQNSNLRHAVSLPLADVTRAHAQSKEALLAEVKSRAGVQLDPKKLLLGFARRATPYKRMDLLLSDPARLREIATRWPLQIVYAGKAHPRDEGGKALIRRVWEQATELDGAVEVVYLPNYDMALGHLICSGVDVWINTPQKPLEASGTSGMKSAINGVPSLSILDGWWIEGHVEGVTGWSIGDSWEADTDAHHDAAQLYQKLEAIGQLFYEEPQAWSMIMRQAIALNGSFFNAQRMIEQYAQTAYGESGWRN